MDEDARLRLPGAWENPGRKDECLVGMNDFERDYWMGTEVGQLGGCGFQGEFFGVDGSCKNGKMGSGCCKFQGEEADKCARVAERRKARVRTGRSLGKLCLRYSQQLLVKMS